jgi:hypothetical protein
MYFPFKSVGCLFFWDNFSQKVAQGFARLCNRLRNFRVYHCSTARQEKAPRSNEAGLFRASNTM